MPLAEEVVLGVQQVLKRFESPAGSELSTVEFARRKTEDIVLG